MASELQRAYAQALFGAGRMNNLSPISALSLVAGAHRRNLLTPEQGVGKAAPGTMGRIAGDPLFKSASRGGAMSPVQIIKQYAPRFGLDPAAVAAYMLEEGGANWGAVGDHGTSFGPFQLHIGGANPYKDPHQASSYANSPQGLINAMKQMAHLGAAGQHGGEAAKTIELRFGRGADPPRTVERALALLPQAQRLVGATMVAENPANEPSAPVAPATGADNQAQRMALAASLVAHSQQLQHGQDASQTPVMQALTGVLNAPAAQTQGSSPAATKAQTGKAATFDLGPSSREGKLDSRLMQLSHHFGLKITSGYRTVEQQAILYAHRSTPGSVAAPGKSLHNKGEAIDVAVTKNGLAFLNYAHAHPEQFTEVFYDPAGWYIKNGKIVKGSIGGHRDHIHIGL